MAQQPVQYTYNPPPQELPFYDALFQQADKSKSGYLSGQTAVEFLSSSKLPMDLLKTIWSMADQPPSNILDKPKFYVAVRLIQLFQNGKRPNDAQLHLGEGVVVRPPYFDGINLQQIQQQHVAQPPQMQPSPTIQPQQVASPQLSPMQPAMQRQPVMQQQQQQPQPTQLQQPQFQLQSQQQNQLVAQDPYSMTPTEQSRYESLFASYASQDGFVYGAQAVELFSKSGMERDALREVWNLSDGDPVDNRLDKVEFAIAMHLIVCVTKKGLPMPSGGALPGTLARVRREAREGAAGAGQGGQDQQQMGQGQQAMGQQPYMQQQQSIVAPSSPGGIPSPDKVSGMGMTQMNGMQKQQQQPQTGVQGMQHQMNQQLQLQLQGGMQPQMGQPQQMQQQPELGGAVGGESIEDAFAGLSAEPVNEDEYSIAPSISGGGMNVGGSGGGYGSGASVMTNQMSGGMVSSQQPPQQTQQHQYQHPPPQKHQNYAAPASPKRAPAPAYYEPASPDSSASSPAPAPSLSPRPTAPRRQNRQPQYQQHQQHPPRSPTHTKQSHTNHDSIKSSHELEHLRSAHQKLQAEVISLRAKASLVSEEERDAQSEIAKVAAQIAELSTELSGLKGQVAEAKVKLAEAVVTLKAMKDEKETLEEAVKETRETHEALTSATEAVVEASESTMHLKAQLLAEHAKAAEAASQPVETADLFSWDAPAPAPVSHTGQHLDNNQSMGTSHWEAPAQVAAPVQSLRIYTNDADDDVSKFGDNQSVFTQNQNANEIPNGMPNQTPFGGGYQSNDNNNAFFPMGGAPAPAPAETPMGGASLYDTDYMGGGMTPLGRSLPAPTPSAADMNHDRSHSISSAAQQQPPPVNSPTAKEVEALKKEALKAEKSFRTSEDLVRTLSREVESLEFAAKRAEEEAKKHESTSQKKKGSFVSGKKKAKKEYEKAVEIAAAERKKADDAREQLIAAQNETTAARKEAEQLRQQYEQAEIEAATAASYMSVQAENAKNHGQPALAPATNQYDDPFGGISLGGNNMNSLNPYGMGLMGGNAQNQGDYANPFL